ncbi:unnamed protein product [Arctogadus glacialis]
MNQSGCHYCLSYFIKHVSNKKRDELEKATALKKNREQIKLLADEIRLLKDEATLNKEQRKLTDLHTTLVRQGLIAAHPLDSGPSEGSDQGKGRGTLGGAYGRMLTTQIPPPVQHTLCVSQQFPQFSPVPPHSFLPQQCLHPNPPVQQPPAERSGAVTKNESLKRGFDDNKQPHCSVMGGAATPHMKTTDEKKEIARDRERFPQSNSDRERFIQSDRQREPRPCHNCGQIGHWQRECKAPRKMYRDRSNERGGEENRSNKMRERLKKLQAKSVEELSRLCDPVSETNNNTDLLDSLDLARKLTDTG